MASGQDMPVICSLGKKNQDYGRSSNEKASFLTNLYSFLKGVDSTVVSQEPSVSAWNKCKEIDYRS